ncbi:MFS transporter [Streptomyces sp. NPDC087228]|uniref:MFS transporter n=1 Tax=unclassified Streptomyces TaxID=2593676 RepID=UPI003407A7D2
MTPGTAGTVGSLAFAGTLVGAPGAGNLSGRLGRRWTVIGCVTRFTVFTAACGFAPNAESFGALRFVAGIGLGGPASSANALTSEFVSGPHRSAVATVMMSGVPLGGCLAVAVPAIPMLGWEALCFYVGTGLLPATHTTAGRPPLQVMKQLQRRNQRAEA